jgi:hypothetical protein
MVSGTTLKKMLFEAVPLETELQSIDDAPTTA